MSRCSFKRNHPEETLPRFLLIISRFNFTQTHPKATLHRFHPIIYKCSFTRNHPEIALPRLLLIYFQMMFYTYSSWSSTTQAPSLTFPDSVSHGLILKQPYTGSFSYISRCNFTQTHHQAALPRFLLIHFQMKFDTDSSWSNPTHVPSHNFPMQFHTDSSWSNSTQVPSHIFSDEVSHGLILKQPYPSSFS